MKINQRLRHRFIGFLSLGMAMLIMASPLQAQEFVEGQDFITVSADAQLDSKGRVEVMEFFWFGCPACFRFETTLLNWQVPEEINFSTVPAAMVGGWVFHAHVYYAMELMGLKEQLMQKFYDELHVKRSRINEPESLEQWLSEQEGVDVEKFMGTLFSFGAKAKVSKAEKDARKFGVNSTPTIVVGRKYRTSPAMAGSDARVLAVVEYLAKRVLAEQDA